MGDSYLEIMGIPLLMALVSAYYGIRLILSKDVTLIRGKSALPVKNPEKYAVLSGYILIIFALLSALMGFLLLVNLYAALIEMGVSLIFVFAAFSMIMKKCN